MTLVALDPGGTGGPVGHGGPDGPVGGSSGPRSSDSSSVPGAHGCPDSTGGSGITVSERLTNFT